MFEQVWTIQDRNNQQYKLFFFYCKFAESRHKKMFGLGVVGLLALGAPVKDEIKEMPGWAGALPSKQYSGFLSVTDADNQVLQLPHNMF